MSRDLLNMAYAGAGWLGSNLGQQRVSNLGNRVAEALGYAFCGIYHLSNRALFHSRVKWSSESSIEIVIGKSLATVDGDELSRLVMACYALGLRLSVSGAAPEYLRLRFGRIRQRYGGVEPFVDSLTVPALPARRAMPAPTVGGGD
jgi:hypothetical protein